MNNLNYKIDWIITPKDLIDKEELVNNFFKLYENPVNFPDVHEREDPKYIRERILYKSKVPYTHLLAYSIIGSNGENYPVGGCIVEFYPDSNCCFLAYLFVHPEWRGKKIGPECKKISETLLKSKDGLLGLVSFIRNNYKKTVQAVLFASNDPVKTDLVNDSIPPAKRFKFFQQMGAKHIEFKYIMPPLSKEQNIVTNLLLLCFPEITNLANYIPAYLIMSFLLELTYSLDINSDYIYTVDKYTKDKITLNNWMKSVNGLDGIIGKEIDGVNIVKCMFISILNNKLNDNTLPLSLLKY